MKVSLFWVLVFISFGTAILIGAYDEGKHAADRWYAPILQRYQRNLDLEGKAIHDCLADLGKDASEPPLDFYDNYFIHNNIYQPNEEQSKCKLPNPLICPEGHTCTINQDCSITIH